MSITKDNNGRAPENSQVGNLAINPNPRANENLPEQKTQEVKKDDGDKDKIGSEITDGEDA